MSILGLEVDLGAVESERLTFGDGDRVMREGGDGTAVHVVISGAAMVETSSGVVLDTLGAGALIGELSAMAGGGRSATVTAVGELTTLMLERDAFLGLLSGNRELNARVSEEAVRRLDERRFADFTARLVGTTTDIPFEDFRRHLTWRWLRSGEVLYRRGDAGDAGFLVVSGRMAVIDGDDANGSVIAEVGQDQFVGESGVLEGRPRQVTVVAVRDTLVAKVSQESAIELLGRHPRVMGPLLLDITRRARQRPGTSPRRTIALSVHTDIDRRVLATRIGTELARHGSAAHLWKARVDSHLDLPGVADSQSGEPADARLSQFLHEVEVGHDHVLFELDAGWSPWSMRATRQADRLVAVVSEGASERSAEDVDRFFSSGTAHAQRVLVVIHAPDAERPRGTASWTARWSPDRILHIRAGSAGDIERVGRFLAGRPIGLVLGGGGARGFAHLGVRRAMLELGIPIDMVGGSSIGAPLGVGIAMDWAQVDYERRVEELFSGILDYTLPIVSLVKGERITASIEKGLSGWTFEDLWRPFFCVSTNLTQSTEMVHRSGDVVPAVRASVSIPGVLPPVSWGEDLLVDGGVLNNLPADIMRSEVEAGTVIAVDVAPPTGPRAKNDLALSVSGWQALRALSGRGKTSYPGITALLMRTMIAGSIRERTRVLERGDVDLYLDLDLRGISLLDFDTVAPVAQAGYEAAMPRLEAWLEAQE